MNANEQIKWAEILQRREQLGYVFNDDADWLISQLKAAQNTWQPIATGPKDGGPIVIGWREADGKWTERRAWWDSAFECLGCDERTEEWHYRGAWTDGAVLSFGLEETMEYKPTHWQPLPQPPKI